jgi:hypothetical protein
MMKQIGGQLQLHSPAAGWRDGFEAVLQLGGRDDQHRKP